MARHLGAGGVVAHGPVGQVVEAWRVADAALYEWPRLLCPKTCAATAIAIRPQLDDPGVQGPPHRRHCFRTAVLQLEDQMPRARARAEAQRARVQPVLIVLPAPTRSDGHPGG